MCSTGEALCSYACVDRGGKQVCGALAEYYTQDASTVTCVGVTGVESPVQECSKGKKQCTLTEKLAGGNGHNAEKTLDAARAASRDLGTLALPHLFHRPCMRRLPQLSGERLQPGKTAWHAVGIHQLKQGCSCWQTAQLRVHTQGDPEDTTHCNLRSDQPGAASTDFPFHAFFLLMPRSHLRVQSAPPPHSLSPWTAPGGATMSDTEAAPVVEEVAAEEVPAGEEAQPELVLPKERVKKPVRPDDTTLKAATDLLHEQIAKNKQRVQQIVQIIEDRKAGRGEGSKEQQAIKSKLAELKSQFQGSLVRPPQPLR